MKKNNKKILVFCGVALLVAGVLTAFVAPNFASAAECKTILLPQVLCDDPSMERFMRTLKAITKALTAGVAILATIGLIICGFFWMTAKDNAQQVATVKRRMLDIVVGLIIWIMFSAFIQFLVPDTSGIEEFVTMPTSMIVEVKK